MIRRTGILAILIVGLGSLISCAQTVLTPRTRLILKEAAVVEVLMARLVRAKRIDEAITLAEEVVRLREKVLGPLHSDIASSLNNLAALYVARRAYMQAEPLLVRALEIHEKTLGIAHPDVGPTLTNLAEVYRAQGVYAKAVPLLIRALEINDRLPEKPDQDVVISLLESLAGVYMTQGVYAKAERPLVRLLHITEEAVGATHPDVASRLHNLAVAYKAQGAYAKAERLLVRSLEIERKVLAPAHPEIALSLNALAELYRQQGAHTKAEGLLVPMLGLQETTLGTTHPNVARSLDNLGSLYLEQGDYAKAEPLLIRALQIREKALGPNHQDVAHSLNNLAELYLLRGAYGRAEPLFVRALEVWEKALGPGHPDFATALNNLAGLYDAQGMYAQAEPLLMKALDINEKALGPRHPAVAQCLNNLAMLYWTQGTYARAEPLHIRALEIRRNALGAMHPYVASTLNNLASVYMAQGDHARAEPLYIEALKIREASLGPMHPSLATMLDNLASVYRAQRAYARAEPLYTRALDIFEKSVGQWHPDVAINLSNLAWLHFERGAYAHAEPLLIRALEILEKTLDPMHPILASTLDALAGLYEREGAYARAVPLRARAAEIHEVQLRRELPRLSASRKRDLMMLLMEETQHIVSLHIDAVSTNPQALELALTTVLRRKGRVLDSLADNQLGLRARLTSDLRGKLDQLAAANTELSTRVRAPFDARTAASRASAIAALRTHIDELELELNTASADFRLQSELVTIAGIQAVLPQETALVEFVRYRRVDSQSPREESYVAYVLRKQGPPQAVTLGEATVIDAAIDAVLDAMHKGTGVDRAKVALQHLGALVLAPLRGQLAADVSHLILSPDARLNLVPFEALVDPEGRYELERRLVSYVTSGRDLLRLTARPEPRSSATIVAAPDYGLPHSSVLNGLGTFRPLDGVSAEIAELPAYFVRARTLTGNQATKAALSAIVGPAVLHIATHGFYARPPTATVNSANKSAVSASDSSTPSVFAGAQDTSRSIRVEDAPFSRSFPPPSTEDPSEALDRAGLALAGANLGPDGIVSARELTSYDWWGTQLVVLSACETGVGAAPSGEDVYGMRRALVLAGAESQVVSLWNVSDSSTLALMRAFYGQLARGTGRAEALRMAKLRVLQQSRFAHPYYWAAFIPAGNWTPLAPHLLRPQSPAQAAMRRNASTGRH